MTSNRTAAGIAYIPGDLAIAPLHVNTKMRTDYLRLAPPSAVSLVLMLFILRSVALADNPEFIDQSKNARPIWSAELETGGSRIVLTAAGELCVGDSRGKLYFLNAASGQRLDTSEAHSTVIRGLVADRETGILYSISRDGNLIVWDAPARRITKRLFVEEGAYYFAVAPKANIGLIGYQGDAPRLARYDLGTGDRMDVTPATSYLGDGKGQILLLSGLGIDATGRTACIATNRKIVLFDFEQKKRMEKLEIRSGVCNAMAFESGIEKTACFYDGHLELRQDGLGMVLDSRKTLAASESHRGLQCSSAQIDSRRKITAAAFVGFVGSPSYIWLCSWKNQGKTILFRVSESPIRACVMADDADVVYTVSDDRKVRAYKVSDFLKELADDGEP